jgi:hypothetical protein
VASFISTRSHEGEEALSCTSLRADSRINSPALERHYFEVKRCMLVSLKLAADFSRGVRVGDSATCISRPTLAMLPFANGSVLRGVLHSPEVVS